MLELFLLKPNEMLQIPTESITWSGSRYSAARKIEAKILWKESPGRDVVKLEEGNTLLFKWDGKELFRGTVFNCSKTKNGLMSVTAYDMLQYLLQNKDVYVFTKKRADEIAIRIMKDFEIPYSSIVNTGYVMKSQVFTNETTLYDMILKSLITTEKQTGNRFYLQSRKGKVSLSRVKENDTPWILETGTNLIDYNYNTSIEETATRVKLVSGEEKKEITAVVTDNKGRKNYGVLQHFERISEKLNKGQLNSRAKSILNQKKGVKKEITIDALGITDLVSNESVWVIEKDLNIDRYFFIDSDIHEFQGNKHTMNLKLIEKNTIPEGA